MISVLQVVLRWRSLQLVLIQFVLNFGGVAAAAKSDAPAAIVVTPSQDWDGNDGPWSSFAVQVGNPPQSVKVFISTAATQTWAIAEEGCASGDPTTCRSIRGGLFNHNLSSTYTPNIANLSSDIYELGLESNLGYTGKGRYGFDDITLGFPGAGGPSLQNQTIAGVATKSFFIGLFGLNPRPSNFTSYNNPVPSYMENLRNQSLLDSLSWAYTAGNQYRLNGVLGSLILGGYDTSKFVPNDVSFSLDPQDSKDLTVQINTITTNDNVSLLPSPIGAFLDSTLPYIYLPIEACTVFEKTFGITWNETSQLYLINNTQHTLLQNANPTITFNLLDPATSQSVDIALPYSAFDLTASYPLTDVPTKYFPLRRATNGTQYTLGRAFFQEAYVVADYDRKKFSVSQCTWDPRATQNVVAIIPPARGTSGSGTSISLPIGAIVGIAVGGVIILALILFFFFWWKPRRRKQEATEPESSPVYQAMDPKPELDSHEVYYNLKSNTQITETYAPKAHPPVEIGVADTIYEMPAREEVAAEMTGLAPPREWDGRRPSDRRGSARGTMNRGSDVFGFPLSPGSSTRISSVNSSPRLSPRSMESPLVSPTSAVNMRRF